MGGNFFDMGRAYPFIFIGLCNYGYFLFLLLMIFLGLFGKKNNKKKGQPKVKIVHGPLIESPDIKIVKE